VDVVIDRGQDKTITIPPQRAGRYRSYCRFHQAEGMRGQIAYS
jgi:plastocyanin